MEEQPFKDEYHLHGLRLVKYETADDEGLTYDIGMVAHHALEALKVAVIAMEQIVTGERLVKSLDIGDFYGSLNRALEEKNGAGVESESGDMASLQEEIEGLIDLVGRARADDNKHIISKAQRILQDKRPTSLSE